MLHIHIHNMITDEIENHLSSVKFFDCVRQIVNDLSITLRDLHSRGNVNLLVNLNAQDIIPSMRTAGWTVSESMISIVVDGDTIKGIDDCLVSEIRSIIVHELHHISRWKVPGYGTSFHEVLISEGLACLAETEQQYSHKIPYIESTKDEIKTLIGLAENQEEDYDHGNRYFGTGNLPNRSGYKLGYHIVSQYAKVVGKTSRELCQKDAKSIISDERFIKILQKNL